MEKSPDAFRTISEVSEWLDTPAHVLRFWESRFAQIKPVKRAGGRRYYRPGDMQLLGGIKKLLHEDGLTIRGVQKILREQGVKHVAAMSIPLGDGAAVEIEQAATPVPEAPMARDVAPPEDNVVALKPAATEAPAEPEAAEAAAPDAAAEIAEATPAPEAGEAPAAEPAQEPKPAPAPLGADLPDSDPADDAYPAAPALTALLRQGAARQRLQADEGAALADAMTRLQALAARMADGG